MNENQDSEPLFDDADYQLLRSDSLLTRLGSNNFASLIEAPAHPPHENENVSHQQQLQQHQHQPRHQAPQQEQMPEMQFFHDTDISDTLFVDNGLLTLSQSDLPLDPWNNMEAVSVLCLTHVSCLTNSLYPRIYSCTLPPIQSLLILLHNCAS